MASVSRSPGAAVAGPSDAALTDSTLTDTGVTTTSAASAAAAASGSSATGLPVPDRPVPDRPVPSLPVPELPEALSWVGDLLPGLRGIEVEGLSDAAIIDLLDVLERVKSATAAVQARVTVQLDSARREAGAAPREVAAEVALARRESPYVGGRRVGLAQALTGWLPCTLASLERGELSERRAEIIASETAVLDRDAARVADLILAGLAFGLGDRALAGAARQVVAGLDAEAVLRRCERAVRERRVSVRPAPDGMAWLSILGPLQDVVAGYAALTAAEKRRWVTDPETGAADSEADGRTVGQWMTDTALALLSGRAAGEVTPVEVSLVLTPEALFGSDVMADEAEREDAGLGQGGDQIERDGAGLGQEADQGEAERSGLDRVDDRLDQDDDFDQGGDFDRGGDLDQDGDFDRGDERQERAGPAGAPEGSTLSALLSRAGATQVSETGACLSRAGTALIVGQGPIPAAWARRWVARAAEQDCAWIQRIFTHPETGDLLAMESARRRFSGGLRRFVMLRDQTCRTPWCNAPIRDIDHLRRVADGGRTEAGMGAGLCRRCNLVKEGLGWATTPTEVARAWAARARLVALPQGPERAIPDSADRGSPDQGSADPWNETADGLADAAGRVIDQLAAASAGRHTYTLRTPSGHTYVSTAPPLTG